MRWTIVTAMMAAAAPAAAKTRVELPIRLVTLPNGDRRFALTLTVDGRPVEAGLDTGSTGLRIMARALPDVPAKGRAVQYGYGAGTRLDGQVASATVAFGAGLAGKVPIERVDRLSCLPERPDCPARGADPATFGIQGDGLPGEGFPAILGANLRAASIGNPFEALDVRRWIVELPRPGDAAPGRLILNPSDAEVAGYARVRFAADDNSLPVCIDGPPPLGRTCAPGTIDSGAPGLRIVAAARHAPVPNGTPATIAIGKGGPETTMQVTIGNRDQASRLSIEQRPGAPAIFLGIAPYFRWSVLYDADAHAIGFKDR